MSELDVFFDMTGTLTDIKSEDRAFIKMCETIAEKFQIDISPTLLALKIKEYRRPFMENRAVRYVPIRRLIADAIEKILNRRLEDDERKIIYKIYEDSHAKYVKLRDDAPPTLSKIREIADIMGIVTDADKPYTESLVKALGVSNIFDCVITAEDAGVGKPNPRIFRLALKCSRSQPKIFVGDSERRDVMGAKRVGFITIKVGTPPSQADYTVPSLRDVASVMAQILL